MATGANHVRILLALGCGTKLVLHRQSETNKKPAERWLFIGRDDWNTLRHKWLRVLG
jgi:hypothetical protein